MSTPTGSTPPTFLKLPIPSIPIEVMNLSQHPAPAAAVETINVFRPIIEKIAETQYQPVPRKNQEP